MAEPQCDFHDDHDPVTERPRGNRCGAPATHRIEWADGRRFSNGCGEHLEIDSDASVKPARIVPIAPGIGSRWIHRRGGRVIKVVGFRALASGLNLVEYKYRRTAGGGVGFNRSTPTQSMELGEWRSLFTKEAS